MRESILKEKSHQFAIQIIELYKYLCNEKKEFVLSKQLLRSWTAIGALVREAEFAESKLDFIHKLKIALKEANESQYRLELLKESKYIDENTFGTLYKKCDECIKMLVASVNTLKKTLNS